MSLTDLATVAATAALGAAVSLLTVYCGQCLSPLAARSQGMGKSCLPSSNPLWVWQLAGEREQQKAEAHSKMPDDHSVYTRNATQFPALQGIWGAHIPE